tara:strand:- start:5269 stop:6885 length:1617 start_codon:yes stop_codon:yes gene_type:complete
MFKFQKARSGNSLNLEMFPTEFVSSFMNIPIAGELEKFSFEGRRYLLPVYDTPAKRVLLQCGRQVEKSTTLGNITLTYAMLRKHFRSLFVSPTQQQTETFSRDRITTPIELSDTLTAFSKGENTKNNVLYKKFLTGSDVTFRYAFLHADRVRGISADMLLLDEIQDILTEVIPVIEEALAHSPFQILRYSGTPKSLDNTISYYWEQFSTQNEWVIPCDGCNKWNVIEMASLGDDGLICTRCGRRIHSDHPRAQWASMRSPQWLANPPIARPFEGYRIPQCIAPWINWDSIMDKKKRYSPAQFYNEVLGLGYDSGHKPITRDMLIKSCTNRSMADAKKFAGRSDIYMGVDWGTGENSYTVMTIGCYLQDRFHILMCKRFEGEESNPETTINIISKYIRQFNVKIVGTDYGGGFDRNDKLIRAFGVERIARYQYVNTRKIYFDKHLLRFMVNRTEALMAIINCINRCDTFVFPKWEEFESPFGTDLLSVFTEYNEARRTTVVSKSPGATDDTLHSLAYCFLASMIRHPRPDIITPDKDKA